MNKIKYEKQNCPNAPLQVDGATNKQQIYWEIERRTLKRIKNTNQLITLTTTTLPTARQTNQHMSIKSRDGGKQSRWWNLEMWGYGMGKPHVFSTKQSPKLNHPNETYQKFACLGLLAIYHPWLGVPSPLTSPGQNIGIECQNHQQRNTMWQHNTSWPGKTQPAALPEPSKSARAALAVMACHWGCNSIKTNVPFYLYSDASLHRLGGVFLRTGSSWNTIVYWCLL